MRFVALALVAWMGLALVVAALLGRAIRSQPHVPLRARPPMRPGTTLAPVALGVFFAAAATLGLAGWPWDRDGIRSGIATLGRLAPGLFAQPWLAANPEPGGTTAPRNAASTPGGAFGIPDASLPRLAGGPSGIVSAPVAGSPPSPGRRPTRPIPRRPSGGPAPTPSPAPPVSPAPSQPPATPVPVAQTPSEGPAQTGPPASSPIVEVSEPGTQETSAHEDSDSADSSDHPAGGGGRRGSHHGHGGGEGQRHHVDVPSDHGGAPDEPAPSSKQSSGDGDGAGDGGQRHGEGDGEHRHGGGHGHGSD